MPRSFPASGKNDEAADGDRDGVPVPSAAPIVKLLGSDFTEATGGMEGGTKVGLIQLHSSE